MSEPRSGASPNPITVFLDWLSPVIDKVLSLARFQFERQSSRETIDPRTGLIHRQEVRLKWSAGQPSAVRLPRAPSGEAPSSRRLSAGRPSRRRRLPGPKTRPPS